MSVTIMNTTVYLLESLVPWPIYTFAPLFNRRPAVTPTSFYYPVPLEYTSLKIGEQTVETLPTPEVESGTILVKPLYSWIFNYSNQIYTNGNPRKYPIAFPIVGGTNAVGRVAAVPADAARVKVPLENALPVDKAALQKHGVSIRDLAFYPQLVVAYGGFRDVGLTAGETVLIAPATGNFGGGAVHVALAMGARVIAMGRNEEILAELKALAPGRVETIVMSGSVETDKAAIAQYGPLDVVQDFTPPMVTNFAHLDAAILSLRPNGRVSLMGNAKRPDCSTAVYMGLTIKGTLWYTRDQALAFIKMIETGTLKLGEKAGFTTKGIFKLEEWEAALECAATEAGAGKAVYFAFDE
ncbi:hypothetical protein M426DRAFT_256491 [Hypoxylon sp. CI-4A]|nr:hypothetical protein M426DRAFT_256491 [Hypoxylon sp. CI-4A]